MNDRIKQLIKQSKPDNWIDLQTRYGELPMLSGDQVEKFAELIVQECIQENKFFRVNSSDRQYFHGWNEAIEKCNDNLREHFGVE